MLIPITLLLTNIFYLVNNRRTIIMKLSVRDMILAALFTALTVVAAKINFLLPEVPITFQPIIVMLAGCVLGSKAAFLSQVVYIAIGLMGVPVFAKPLAGPAYIVTSSFGYLIGFAVGAYVIGLIVEKSVRKSLYTFITANMTGLIIVYFFGVMYLYGLMNIYIAKPMSLMNAITLGILPFLAKDIILCIAVSGLSFTIYRRIKSQLKKPL